MNARAASCALVLFTRDLRLEDQAAVAEASRFGAIVPLLVIDDALVTRLASPRRAAYFVAAVASLDAALRERGSALVVRRGDLATTVRAVAREVAAAAVVWSAAYDRAAVAALLGLQARLEEAGLRAYGVHDAPAVAPEETAAARSDDRDVGYRALAPYLAVWRSRPREVHSPHVRFAPPIGEMRTERLPEVADFTPEPALPPAGVSTESVSNAFARYLTGAALQYNVASRVPASSPTARLSAALAFGVVSSRSLLAKIDERLGEPFLLAEERVALRSLQTSLAERDFFLQLAHYYEELPDRALRATREAVFERSHPLLATWLEGRTGYPLVDAGMRQLHATGWMHPHVRRVAASFLCFDLGVDWRVGRDAWERHLEEDDLALASGNWQWSAGVGADLAAVPRIFNPRKQLRRFDPSLAYVRRFLPELADVPTAEILGEGGTPRPQLSLALYGPSAYPQPVLDHETAARAFLAKYARTRKAS